MISIQTVSKAFGTVKAIRDITLTVSPNTLYGLIGPDGAGKTTLFRLITTLLLPDHGNITVFGCNTVNDYRKIRLFTGYMPGRFSLYPDLTVSENLSFYATIFGTSVKENYHLISSVYSFLEPFKDRLARNLSGGMKQKLALCCALIHNPRLLVLDEPTTGVDAVSRKEFWETLYYLKETGMTILVSTPYMDEAAKCDRVALMQQGAIMHEDSPAALLAAYHTSLFEVHASDKLKTLEALRSMHEIKRAYLFGNAIHLALNESFNEYWIYMKLATYGIDAAVTRVQPDFEDCFIEAVEQENKLM